MENWPNFFIVGAGRSGTTSLYEYLKNTNGVFFPEIKEPNFFSKSVNSDLLLLNPIKDKKKYLELYKHTKNAVAIGDATPIYLWDPLAPKLIHDVVPDAKIIIILRNPIERAYSHFLQLVSYGRESHPFSSAIKKALKAPPDYSGRIIEGGLYYEQVKRYLEIFGKEHVRIYIFEEFFKNPRKYFLEILNYLGISEEPPKSLGHVYNAFVEPKGKISEVIMKSESIKKIGKKIIPRSADRQLKEIFGKKTSKPPIPQDAKKLLEEIYRDDVKKLEKLLDRTFPWDLSKK